eukprot:TRINITY_DN34813_c0_g1_i1.p3 TRINITY_DN34813_c0_g1~~TRINITY_DN34813_c0_g1_i1.p3  ORF type:complete len:126 (+),score=7.44 TRINITY_DN34813_c0_g1_i1:34-411(+)
MDVETRPVGRCSLKDMRVNKLEVRRLSVRYEAKGDKDLPVKRRDRDQALHDEEIRKLHWRLLGPTLKIQRWYRRLSSRKSVQRLLMERRDRHTLIWQSSAAETIQTAWKSYLVRRGLSGCPTKPQ